jgi:hypothetical protein
MRSPLLAALLLAGPAFAQATGTIVGSDGKPIPGVSACIYKDGKQLKCTETDSEGHYRLEHPGYPNLLLEMKGYKTTSVPASPLSEPTVLVQTASLLVKVVDAASGDPIPTGMVSLNLPSGRKLGSPVPFNKAGVKLGTLSPGDTMVVAEAIGYEPSGPVVVTLVGGESKELIIRLTKAAR